ncbi:MULTISPECIES: NAD(P)/FAD-dependent oxidoreductase [unclassified Virgibacillus]|uniref:NAD(P)/FAD-dependent oxidoreductase n=1 Tax=unclassified Virgibacillus TaxID=2620237 RepID=UPI0009097953|nr:MULTISPECIES: NAD(P)/FAD-dependent oxidoreductase [unclassified Virgibacillus]API92027.1 ferredoxin--NADP(+) reductase [Virgibacillus sp. 6R]MBS7430492.1 NAD(P)/FAD-dependent oxidoreductase [Virgibacillus sp. 19R1-5]
MISQEKIHDITIIGGGPVGLFTAFYAGMRQASVKIIESLPHLGGQLAALYPDKFVYDVAGFPKIRAKDLISNLVNQMKQFDADVCLEEMVLSVAKKNDLFELTTNKNVHYSRTIIITAGNGAFKPRTMRLENEENYYGKNLHYSIGNLSKFKNKNVVVFGGGDSAVDWALMLNDIASNVTIVHRRERFRAHDYSVKLLKESPVNIFTPYVPIKILGKSNAEIITIKQPKSDETIDLVADEYIVNYGFVSNLGPINNWGLTIKNNLIQVNSKAETNIPGIYAVGDISTYEGKVKLMATGFGEAPIAVSNAKVRVDPTQTLQAAHSTSIMSKEKRKNKVGI